MSQSRIMPAFRPTISFTLFYLSLVVLIPLSTLVFKSFELHWNDYVDIITNKRVLAACLVTWFTFLPSFLFIFAGGPLIETTHNNLRFTAPLTAITAAVVGVILNLAVFFGYHVLWPNGLQGLFDWPSALIAVAAGVALFKYQSNVIHVIIVCGLLGVCLKWLLP